MYFRRAHRPLQCVPSAPCYAARAGTGPNSFVLLETGVGGAAVKSAFDWLLAAVPHPRWVVYAGFAGALDPALRIGDVLLADPVTDADARCWQTSLPVPLCSGVQSGRLFTADRLVGAADDKRRLASAHGACMVDMEAAHAAARCAAAAIPFFSLRAISDTADTSLSPALSAILVGGRVSTTGVVRALCCAPSLLPELCRLGRDTRIAARQLATALDALLSALATLPLKAGNLGRLA